MADARTDFQYTILRVVPRVERGERVNVGVVLFCPQKHYLAMRFALDAPRLSALDATLEPDRLLPHMDSIAAVVSGDQRAGALAALPASDRFGWVAAPSSTIIQPSEVHTGISADPATTLDRLFIELVLPRGEPNRTW